MTPGNASPAFEPVARHIEGLSPDSIKHELMPLLHQERDGLIARTLAVGEIEPAQLLFGSLEHAMERVKGETQTILGERVVGAVVSNLGKNTRMDSLDTALTFFDMARSVAGGISADPKEQARTISSIAKSCSHYPVDYDSTEEPYKVARHVQGYIGDAAEAAVQAAHPAVRASALVEVAEASAKSTEQLAKNIATNGYKGKLEVYDQLFKEIEQQPLSIYKQALTAASLIPKPSERMRERHRIVVSMARSAANSRYGEAFISDDLVYRAVYEIVETLKGYEPGGEFSKMTAARKANSLLRLGSELGAVIEWQSDKTYQLATSWERRDLIKLTARTFLRARDYAQTISPAAKILSGALSSAGIAQNRYDVDRSASHSTLTFANRIVKTNFELARTVLTAGFDLATLRDSAVGDTSKRDEVLLVINNNATSNERTVKEAFELFSLGHSLAGRFNKSKHRAERQRQNVDNALSRIVAMRPEEGMALERIDHKFVNFMIQTATQPGSAVPARRLHALSAFVQDPRLVYGIREGAKVLRLREQIAQEPQNETARIIKEVIG